MAIDFNVTNFDKTITDGVTNSGTPTIDELGIGIEYNSNSDAVIVNKFLYNLSSSIKYIQEAGHMLWQKDKSYNLGSIVHVLELRQNDYLVRKFECINTGTTGTPTTQPPLNGSLSINPKTLSTYFYNVSSVNKLYWKEIFEKDYTDIHFECIERTNGVKLFDIPQTGFYRNNLNILIQRFNTNTLNWDILRFSIEFQVNDFNNDTSNVYIEIYDVFCSNYERSSYTPQISANDIIEPEEYGFVFGKNRFTLLGITVSIKNGSLNLDIYSDNFSYIDDTKNIKIDINNNYNQIKIIPTIINTYNGFVGEDVLVIRENKSNTNFDCGYIIESKVKLTTEEMFKRGLLLITEENCINPNSTRPGFSKPFGSQFDPNKVVNVISDLENNFTYDNHILPQIEGSALTQWGSYMALGGFLTIEGPIDMLGLRNSIQGLGSYVADTKSTDNVYVEKGQYVVNHGAFETNIFSTKNPEVNILTQEPTLYPKSLRVYRYFKY